MTHKSKQNTHRRNERIKVLMKKSDLYSQNQHFNIYICNNLSLFSLLTQGNSLAGAVTQYNFTRAIFFRPCDIKRNKIIPPKEWYFAKYPFAFKDRPLVYYFAHEMTHVMQSRFTGRCSWRYPSWLTEGYADYIGKGGHFDFYENLKLWHNKAPELDPTKGLYRLHHLKIAYLLDHQGKKIREIYKNIPDESELASALWALPVK